MTSIFTDKTFLFTGKLKNMKRDEAEATVKSLGGKCVSGVSKTLSVLVATSDTGAKWTKSLELNSKGANIQFWTEEQFMAEQEKAETKPQADETISNRAKADNTKKTGIGEADAPCMFSNPPDNAAQRKKEQYLL